MAPALWRGRKRIRPFAGESVAEWGRRVLGRAAAEQLLFPALQGIYAGDPTQLSANLVCASLLGPKPPRGRWRGSIAPRGGMGELIAKLCADVEARGGKIHLGSSAEPRPGEIWVKAGAPEQGPELLPVATVTLAFRAPRFDLRGFGCLFPRGEGFRALGVLSNHNIFAGRGRSETWLFGGALDRGVIALGDAELIALARAERQRLYGAHEPADEAHVVRWPRAIPHYTLAWEQRLTEIRQGPEVYEAGNHLGQLGLARLLEGNQRLAARIVSDHG
jgi:oxygen-dependent protoporphyrinogen oxidase